MAIGYQRAGLLRRGDSGGFIGAVAYCHGLELTDDRTGLTYDYSDHQDVDRRFVMAPEGAPCWATDAFEVARRFEKAARQYNAQMGRRVVAAIPNELSATGQDRVVERFTQAIVDEWGVVAVGAIHGRRNLSKRGRKNTHLHLNLTNKAPVGESFSTVIRAMNKFDLFKNWRTLWEHIVNEELAREGFEARIDIRSYADRGIDLEPQLHEGEIEWAKFERTGHSDVIAHNEGVKRRNADRAAAKANEILQARAVKAELLRTIDKPPVALETTTVREPSSNAIRVLAARGPIVPPITQPKPTLATMSQSLPDTSSEAINQAQALITAMPSTPNGPSAQADDGRGRERTLWSPFATAAEAAKAIAKTVVEGAAAAATSTALMIDGAVDASRDRKRRRAAAKAQRAQESLPVLRSIEHAVRFDRKSQVPYLDYAEIPDNHPVRDLSLRTITNGLRLLRAEQAEARQAAERYRQIESAAIMKSAARNARQGYAIDPSDVQFVKRSPRDERDGPGR